MHPLLALALILAAGIAITHVSLPAASPLRRSAGAGAATAALVGAGILLGPGLGVLDGATLRGLAPLTALTLGWIGAALGARLPWALLRRIPRPEWAAGAAIAAGSFGATTLAILLIAWLVPSVKDAWQPPLPAIVTLGAIGTMGASRLAGATRRVTLLATLLGIAAFAGLLASYRAGTLAPGRGVVRLIAMLAFGAGSGILAVWLARLREGRSGDGAEGGGRELELVAAILAGAGLGIATRLSPFIICGIAGAVLAGSASPSVVRARRLLLRWEPPLYGLMLVLAGAMLRLPTWWLVPAAVGLAVARIAARWLLLRYGRAWPPLARLPAAAALAALAPGSAVIAVALSHELAFRSPASVAGAILATALAGALLADTAAAVRARAAGAPVSRPLTAAAPHAEVT